MGFRVPTILRNAKVRGWLLMFSTRPSTFGSLPSRARQKPWLTSTAVPASCGVNARPSAGDRPSISNRPGVTPLTRICSAPDGLVSAAPTRKL